METSVFLEIVFGSIGGAGGSTVVTILMPALGPAQGEAMTVAAAAVLDLGWSGALLPGPAANGPLVGVSMLD